MSGRVLVGLALALAVAFVIAPSSLAGGTYGRSGFDNGPLVDVTRTSLVAFWKAGAGDFSPSLQSTVDYWVRYHVAKALIAAALSVVLIVLGARAWRALARAEGRGRTAALTSAGAGVTMLALFAMSVVMANVQGAIAPFSSLLSLLGPEQRGGELAVTIDQIRQMLAQSAGVPGGQRSLALDTIVGDFSRYHAALAVMAAVGTAALAVVAATSWRAGSSPTRSSAPSRGLLRASGVSSGALALLMLLVTVANVSNATAPEQGLLLFFGPAISP